MSTFGRRVLGQTGHMVQVSADEEAEMRAGGVTMDWATVAAATADTTTTDQTLVRAGQKFLRFGQVICLITASGMFGPFDPAASDGRQSLGRGKTYIVNETTLMDIGTFIPAGASDHPPALEGGKVWKDRIIATNGTASLAAGPAFADLEVAMPLLSYVQSL